MTGDLIHGGAIDQMRMAYPNAPEPWIDLSTGINPWPYPRTDLSPASLAHLPTTAMYEACREAMASALGVAPGMLLLSPGSELLIRLLPDIIHPRRIAILSPTYGDHAMAWERVGAEIIHTPDPLSCSDRVDAIVLCHPNNPDGRLFDLDSLEATRQKLAARGGWLIIDEAYADLVPSQSLAPEGGADGLIILRSFGKFFGLAGVRLGAMLAPAPIRKAMSKRLGVWPVSGSALEIGARAYADTDWQVRTRERLHAAARELDVALKAAGLSLTGGTDLFRLVETEDAHAVFHRLATAGVYVRRFEGSSTHLRIGLPATSKAQTRLLNALTL